MNWIKRNMFMVAGALVALVLLGVAGFYLLTQYQRDASISAKLTEATEQFKKLNQRKPTVIGEYGKTNIALAKVEQKRVEALLLKQKELFAPVTAHTNMDSSSFKSMLETTIDGLEKAAERQGVRTPKGYSYTFGAQRQSLVFNADDLMPWSLQLMEIKAICEAVYQARVHSFQGVRRAAATRRDGGAAILARKAATNMVVNAVTTPYEIVFYGFTPELAAVLDNLTVSPHAFVVKNIGVERAGGQMAETPVEAAAAASAYAFGGAMPDQPRPRSAEETMRSRYGVGPRGAPARPTPQQPRPMVSAGQGTATSASKKPETILDERLLKFTVLLEAVRLRETTAK